MVTALTVSLLLSCRMVAPVPQTAPVRVTCEGADRVRRNHDGQEIGRAVNACTTVRCEGSDRVRRTYASTVVSRDRNACTVARCEGWDFVVRSTDGLAVTRLAQSRRCTPPPERPAPTPESLRFGLTWR